MKALLTLLRTNDRIEPPLLRLFLGVVFFPHGAQKVFGWFGGYGLAGTLGFFTQQMHIPALFALLAIAAEFAGSLGLIVGLLTRVAALGILANMLVAVATVHSKVGFFMNWSGKQPGEGFEFHLLAIGMALALIIAGGGKLSADRALADPLAASPNDEAQKIQNPTKARRAT
ncbi:MAG: DoxX family protein [Verrucomicrobia bacterium]|nr:DoxX family protein [Verrucomicrobiota bacterium]